jgi:hypothetical protein
MMAKEATERYQTPAEVSEALVPWTQTPIPPPPPEEMPETVTLPASAPSLGRASAPRASMHTRNARSERIRVIEATGRRSIGDPVKISLDETAQEAQALRSYIASWRRFFSAGRVEPRSRLRFYRI